MSALPGFCLIHAILYIPALLGHYILRQRNITIVLILLTALYAAMHADYIAGSYTDSHDSLDTRLNSISLKNHLLRENTIGWDIYSNCGLPLYFLVELSLNTPLWMPFVLLDAIADIPDYLLLSHFILLTHLVTFFGLFLLILARTGSPAAGFFGFAIMAYSRFFITDAVEPLNTSLIIFPYLILFVEKLLQRCTIARYLGIAVLLGYSSYLAFLDLYLYFIVVFVFFSVLAKPSKLHNFLTLIHAKGILLLITVFLLLAGHLGYVHLCWQDSYVSPIRQQQESGKVSWQTIEETGTIAKTEFLRSFFDPRFFPPDGPGLPQFHVNFWLGSGFLFFFVYTTIGSNFHGKWPLLLTTLVILLSSLRLGMPLYKFAHAIGIIFFNRHAMWLGALVPLLAVYYSSIGFAAYLRRFQSSQPVYSRIQLLMLLILFGTVVVLLPDYQVPTALVIFLSFLLIPYWARFFPRLAIPVLVIALALAGWELCQTTLWYKDLRRGPVPEDVETTYFSYSWTELSHLPGTPRKPTDQRSTIYPQHPFQAILPSAFLAHYTATKTITHPQRSRFWVSERLEQLLGTLAQERGITTDQFNLAEDAVRLCGYRVPLISFVPNLIIVPTSEGIAGLARRANGEYRVNDIPHSIYLMAADQDQFQVVQQPVSSSAPSVTINVVNENSNYLELDISTQTAGYFYQIETWDPHWRATVDGQAVPILPANYAFRAVAIPAGRHQLVLSYASWFPFLLALSLIGIWTAIICVIIRRSAQWFNRQ